MTETMKTEGAKVSIPMWCREAALVIGEQIAKTVQTGNWSADETARVIFHYAPKPQPVLDDAYYMKRFADGAAIADLILSGRPLIDTEEVTLEESRERELEGSQFGMGA